MDRLPDPYRELGVLRGATDAQVKAAHRRLAKRFHPDAPEGDHDRFLAIQEAYQLLSDPLRRRDWDAAHAPGPVRAGDPAKPRPRGAGGPPRARSSGSGGARGSAGAGKRAGGSGGSAGENERSGTAWSASDREPASRSTTWSASGVPWWEDFSPRDKGAEAAGAGRAGSAGAAGPGAGAGAAPGGTPRPGSAGAPGSRGGTGDASSRSTGTASGGPGAPGSASGSDGTGAGPQRTTAQRSPDDVDVYSRSSGAAWSMAARRYFRKGEAELPKGGAWTYRGTQVVTGAEARKVAAEQAAERRREADREAAERRQAAEHRKAAESNQAAERRRAAEDLLRSRAPGPTGAPRQAFSHETVTPSTVRPGPPREASTRETSTRATASRPIDARSSAAEPPAGSPPSFATSPEGSSGSSLLGKVRRALGIR